MAHSGSISVRGGSRSGRRRRAWGFEPLEGRVVPSTITVMNTHDSGPGSLRAAITQADMDTSQDTIDFAPAVTGTITLLSALPDLTGNTIVSGPGASVLTVARSAAQVTPDFRIFTVDTGAEVTISGLTISGGHEFFIAGGGIKNAGTLTLTDCTLSGNSSFLVGGGIDNSGTLTLTDATLSGNSGRGGGGGIANDGGTVTVTNSTLNGNGAFGGGGLGDGFGGGIVNSGTVTLTNSTLSGNSATVGGGGIANDGGTVTLTDATLSGNAPVLGGAGGIANDGGTVTALNSIFSNPVGGNLVVQPGATFVSMGHNLFSDTPAVALNPTDLTSTNPLLAPLGNYGGPTQTLALLPGSPAIDAGVAVAGLTTDQRGVPRPQGQAPDIGAFESRGFTLTIVSWNNQSTPAGSAFATPLVVAVASPFGEPVGGGRVTFSAPTSGPSLFPTSHVATIGADGRAAVTPTANSLGGTYVVVAGASGSGSVPFVLNNTGGLLPTVARVLRLGVHQQPTQLLIFFNLPLDPARAHNTSNYTLTTTGPRPSAIAIDAALYDPTTRSVTLVPHQRLSLTRVYLLTVRGSGPGAVASASGVPLDGTFQGKPGTNFTTQVFGGGFPRWVGATGPGLSNSPLGNDGPTASEVDALFARSARISASRAVMRPRR
jgi:hypothetical protein